jgi:hypothetical protein
MRQTLFGLPVWLTMALFGSHLPGVAIADSPFELPEPVETLPANEPQLPVSVSETTPASPDQPPLDSATETLPLSPDHQPQDAASETLPSSPDIPSIAADEPVANEMACDVDSGECYVPSPCCGQLCPCRYFWAEALILDRDNQADDRAMVLNLNTNAELLRAGDLDFDVAGGLRIGYGARFCDCRAYEFVYLGVFDQEASAHVGANNSLRLPDTLGSGQVNNFFGADSIDVRYTSDLHSFEANLVRCCCCNDCCSGQSIEWLAGFRYVNLDEDFILSSFDSAEGTSQYSVGTENNLYGAQVGARLRRCRGCWSWEATGKTGIFVNDMEQTQNPIIDFPNSEYRPRLGSSDTDLAFVGDLNLTAIYHLNRVWGVRAGYNLIWIEGVALAADQLDFSNTIGSGTHLADGAGVFLHGVNVGLEARW